MSAGSTSSICSGVPARGVGFQVQGAEPCCAIEHRPLHLVRHENLRHEALPSALTAAGTAAWLRAHAREPRGYDGICLSCWAAGWRPGWQGNGHCHAPPSPPPAQDRRLAGLHRLFIFAPRSDAAHCIRRFAAHPVVMEARKGHAAVRCTPVDAPPAPAIASPPWRGRRSRPQQALCSPVTCQAQRSRRRSARWIISAEVGSTGQLES